MKVDQFIHYLEKEVDSAAAVALTAAAESARSVIESNIPASRIKTRRALTSKVRKRREGYEGSVSLRFRIAYPAEGTRTQRIFRRGWRRAKPRVIATFKKTFSRKLKGL